MGQVKVAEEIAQATPKNYKYNSLAEYLDDVNRDAYEFNGVQNPASAPNYYSRIHPHTVKNRLLQDETMYNQAKQNAKQGLEPAPYEVRFDKNGNTVTTEWADVLSPQAKKEMSEYKDFVKQYRGEEHWSRPDDMQEWIDGVRIPF